MAAEWQGYLTSHRNSFQFSNFSLTSLYNFVSLSFLTLIFIQTLGPGCAYKKAQNALGPWNGIFNTNFIYSLRNKVFM